MTSAFAYLEPDPVMTLMDMYIEHATQNQKEFSEELCEANKILIFDMYRAEHVKLGFLIGDKEYTFWFPVYLVKDWVDGQEVVINFPGSNGTVYPVRITPKQSASEFVSGVDHFEDQLRNMRITYRIRKRGMKRIG